ncbi:hypothetical protein BE24_0214 [Staphylococcus phage vB_SepM_BE24]|nr:hypothetical protein BE24_0214 [Staphylococcus phage vB_SepM_BE24]
MQIFLRKKIIKKLVKPLYKYRRICYSIYRKKAVTCIHVRYINEVVGGKTNPKPFYIKKLFNFIFILKKDSHSIIAFLI